MLMLGLMCYYNAPTTSNSVTPLQGFVVSPRGSAAACVCACVCVRVCVCVCACVCARMENTDDMIDSSLVVTLLQCVTSQCVCLCVCACASPLSVTASWNRSGAAENQRQENVTDYSLRYTTAASHSHTHTHRVVSDYLDRERSLIKNNSGVSSSTECVYVCSSTECVCMWTPGDVYERRKWLLISLSTCNPFTSLTW